MSEGVFAVLPRNLACERAAIWVYGTCLQIIKTTVCYEKNMLLLLFINRTSENT